MIKFKVIKFKYRKKHQRAKFNGVRFLKFEYSHYPKGNINMYCSAKRKINGRAISSVFLKINRGLKRKRKHVIVWCPLQTDKLDFKKTKGVRMGGGRGKHFFNKMHLHIGLLLVGGWVPGWDKKKYLKNMKKSEKLLGFSVICAK